MDTESTKIAKDIIQNIIRSKKTLRMYPENNPIYIKTIDTNYNAFKEVFDYRDELTFRIKQLEIIFDGDQVYYKPDKDDNLALYFFKDGIRELTFRSGLQKKEFEDFLKIITLDFDKEAVDDDIVTLMWERDFQNISYIVDETFLTDEDNYEEAAVNEVKEKAAGEDEVLKAYEDAFGAEDTRYVPIVPLTDEDIEKLKQEVDKESGYYVFKLVNLLFEMIFLAEKKDDYQDMVSLFRSAVDYAIQYSEIEIASDILKKVNEVLHSETGSELLKPYLRMILSYINSERVIKLLGEVLDSRAELDDSHVNELFSLMDKSSIPGLIKILGELNTIHARKTVINALIILGGKDLAAVAKGLNDARWYVVRNIIYVLRNIGDKRAVEYLTKKLKHNDIRVRKEVIKALGDLGGGESVRYLKGFLDDPDPSIRGLTAKSLALSSSPIARRFLLDRLSSSDFKNKDFDEKKEFYEAISRWNDKEIINILVKILRKSSLFRRAKTNENRACAAYALGLIGNKDILEFLKKYLNIKNTLIREYINTAIKRIEHGFAGERTK